MRKKIYVTSDWHIGHANVLKFDQRPFKDLDEMHETLVKNFNHAVPKHGVTYFLGDMGLCSNGLLKSVISRLNGTKVLVRGNHDGGVNSMYEAGFDVVIDKAQLKVSKYIITLSHCPLVGVFREDTTGMHGCDGTENWHKERNHQNRYSFPDFGQFHLHGHVHARGEKVNKKKIKDGRQWDVGVMGNNYKPVRWEEIESWVWTYAKEHGLDKKEPL
jgi:calcineurin-like phosphoesterase family protein